MVINVNLGRKPHSFDRGSVQWPYSFPYLCPQAEFTGLFLRAIQQIVGRTLD